MTVKISIAWLCVYIRNKHELTMNSNLTISEKRYNICVSTKFQRKIKCLNETKTIFLAFFTILFDLLKKILIYSSQIHLKLELLL